MVLAATTRSTTATELQRLSRALRGGRPHLVGSKGESVSIPPSLHALLKDAVRNLEQGRSMVLLPKEEPISAQAAAKFLGLSRAQVVQLLNDGELRSSVVGKQRRLSLSAVLEYAKRAAARKAALRKIARDAYAAGLYENYADMPPGGSDQ